MAEEEIREEELEETPEEEYEEQEEEVEAEEEDVEAEGYDEETSEEEDPSIPIVYEVEGKTVEKNIPYSQLANMVRDYENLNNTLRKYVEYVEAANPIIQTVQNSEILQSILYYKSQGYSEDQIKYGLAKLWSQSGEQKEYASYEDELKDKLLKEIELRLKPLEQKTQYIETEKQIEAVSQHNNQILRETMNELGISELTPEQLREMGKNLAEMFPNTDFRLLRLNKTIAKALIQLVAGNKTTSKSKSVPASKSIKLPKIIQQKGVKTLPDKDLKGKEGRPMSLEERIKMKKELFR